MRGWLLVLLLVVICSPAPAWAQKFAPLTMANIAQTLVRFDALNINNDAWLDDYAQLNDCAEYVRRFRDDFALQARRMALRKKLEAERKNYPDSYYFTSEMQLDRYDFNSRIFRLHEKSRLVNINSFSLVRMRGHEVCVKGANLKMMPEEIGAVLDQPVTLEGLPISKEQSKNLIDRMNALKNFDRKIYARFSLTVVYAPELGMGDWNGRYDVDAQLLAIEFFEDPQMTKAIWVYTRG